MKEIQGRAGFKPGDLPFAEGVVERDLLARTVAMVQNERQGFSWGNTGEAFEIGQVVFSNFIVILGVSKGEGEHPLLFEVGLMNASKVFGKDGNAIEIAGLHRRVLARGSLAIVFVADGDPGDAGFFVIFGDFGEGLDLPGLKVHPFADLLSKGVLGPCEEIIGDILEVTPKLEPLARRRDVIGRTLALSLEKDPKVSQILARPGLKGLEELQPLG